MSDISPREVKAMLQGQADQLARELAPDGRVEGPFWSAANPRWADGHKGSFKIYRHGPKAGGFVEFRGDGERGDVLHLVAYCHGVADWRGREGIAFAMGWAKQRLGLSTATPAARRVSAEAARAAAEAAAKREAELDTWKRRRAFEIWMEAGPIHGLGGIARVYLEETRRSGPLRADEDLRLHPGLAHWTSEKPRPTFPAIITPCRTAAGDIVAVHCTFLAPDGRSKAKVAGSAKLMLGPVDGTLAHLSRGGGGYAWEDETPRPTILCEGVETGRTIAGTPIDGEFLGDRFRVVAALSLGNMGAAPIAGPAYGDVLVNMETTGNRITASQQATVMFKLRTRARLGQAVREMATPAHVSDFNDLAMED